LKLRFDNSDRLSFSRERSLRHAKSILVSARLDIGGGDITEQGEARCTQILLRRLHRSLCTFAAASVLAEEINLPADNRLARRSGRLRLAIRFRRFGCDRTIDIRRPFGSCRLGISLCLTDPFQGLSHGQVGDLPFSNEPV
jgi:hypothetical protein